MGLSLNQYRQLVLEKLDLIDTLHKVDPTALYNVGQSCFCPFHSNENTPAAAIYGDDDYLTLYCFSERKLYNVIDVLEKLIKVDPYMIGQKLWGRMSDDQKSEWLSMNPTEKYKSLFEEDKLGQNSSDNKKSNIDIYKEKYRRGLISINDFLGAFVKK